MLKLYHVTEPDWVIITPDDRIVGLNKRIGKFAGDGSDGLKESFVLIPAWMLNKSLRYDGAHIEDGKPVLHNQAPIIYPTKEIAERVLPDISEKIRRYYGVTGCRIATIETSHEIDTNGDYLSYGKQD